MYLNLKLLHLDLSHIDLISDEILLLGDAMKNSKSLISIIFIIKTVGVHLSGNNLSIDILKQIKIKLKIIKSFQKEDDEDNELE